MRSTNQTDVRLTVATKDRITLQLNSDDPLSVSSPPEPTEPQISPRTFAQLPIPKFQVPNEIELLQVQSQEISEESWLQTTLLNSKLNISELETLLIKQLKQANWQFITEAGSQTTHISRWQTQDRKSKLWQLNLRIMKLGVEDLSYNSLFTDPIDYQVELRCHKITNQVSL